MQTVLVGNGIEANKTSKLIEYVKKLNLKVNYNEEVGLYVECPNVKIAKEIKNKIKELSE